MIYHLASIFINDLMPTNTNWAYFILSDPNVLACTVFFIIENTQFDEKFIKKMNRGVFCIVIISLIFSIIQIKFPYFFISPILTEVPENFMFLEQHRKFSIFSWVDLNSLGITFPILISILLSTNKTETITFPLTIISGIVVSFLSRARYVMVSAIIVFSQLFFVSKIDFRKKIYIILVVFSSVLAIIAIAKIYDYDIQQVIDERILEKSSGLVSARARIISYEVFLLKFPEHPVFGVGPATKLDVVQLLRGFAPLIHVGYLSYLYYYGIAGALLVFLTLFFLLKNSWNVGRKYLFWGSFYGLLSFCFANATFVYFNFSEIGIILAILYVSYYRNKESLPEISTVKLDKVTDED
jgi:hypothetical protein